MIILELIKRWGLAWVQITCVSYAKFMGKHEKCLFVLCCTVNLNHVKHPLFKLNQRWALDLLLPRSWSTRPFPLIPLSERAPFLSVRWKFCFCHLMICYQLATLFLASRWQWVTAPRLSGPLSCYQVFTIDNCFQPFKWSSMQWSPKQMTYVFRRTTAKRVSVKPMQGSISEEVRILIYFDRGRTQQLLEEFGNVFKKEK